MKSHPSSIDVRRNTSKTALVALVALTTYSASAVTQTWNTGTGTWDLTQAVWTPGPTWTNGNDAAINRTDVPFITIGSAAISASTITITNTGTPVFQGNLNNLSFTNINVNTTGNGKLAIYATNPVGSASNILSGGTINISNAATLFINSNATVASNITVTGAGNGEGFGAIRLADATKISGVVTLSGNSNIGAVGTTAEISGQVTGGFGINKINTGTLTLSGINDYTGNTTITAGTLKIGSAGTLGAGATYAGNIANSGTFQFSSSANQTLSGAISGAGAGGLVKDTGIGTLTLTGTNTYTGNTTVSAGTLRFAKTVSFYNTTSGGAISGPNAAKLIVNSGGTAAFNVGGTGEFSEANIGTLLSASTASVGFKTGSRLGLDTTAGDFIYGSAIANPNSGANTLGLTKLGSNTLTLNGSNTYTGTTTVSAGTLLVNGSTAAGSTVNVASGATLGGTGTIGGAVNVTGVLAPGASIESLGTGAISFQSGSTLAYELNSASLNGDLLDSNGTLDIVSGSILTLNDLATATLTSGKITLISYMGGWTNTELFTYLGNTLSDGATFTLGTTQWMFDYNDTSGGTNFAGEQTGATSYVTMTAIPEPNVAALLGGLGLLTLLRRRR